MTKVEFLPDSKLQTVEDEVFFGTLVTSFCIPSHVTKIGKLAFFNCPIQIIEINEILDITSINLEHQFDWARNVIIMVPVK